MLTKTYQLANEVETVAWAQALAKVIRSPLVLGFSGCLGAGKTTLVRAMLRELGITGAIKSPTYAILESYSCPSFVVYHFDLYRLSSDDELELIGFRDCVDSNAVCCIEWPENTSLSMQSLDVLCSLDIKAGERVLQMSARSILGEQWLRSGERI